MDTFQYYSENLSITGRLGGICKISELKPERFCCPVRLIGRRLSYKLNEARQMRQNGIPVQAAKEHSVHLSTDARL